MKLRPQVPVETREATILVEGLEPGAHRFRLEVFNEKGVQSAPAFLTVEMRREERPTR